MADTLFEFLFKYPRLAYEQGEIVLASSWSVTALAGTLAAGALLVAASYARGAGGHARWPLLAVRVVGIALVGLCLLRPTLVLSTAVPGQNLVAVVVDDSRSMGIADVDGATRGAAAREAFATPGSPLVGALEDRFVVRHFAFSSGTRRLGSGAELGSQGTRTRIGPALDHVRAELASLPLSAIVLVSDGGDQEPAALQDAILALRAEGIPVHTVGVGRERLEPDVEVERVEVPSSVIRGSTILAEVVVGHQGLDGRRVPVQVLEEGRILASHEVELPRGGGSVTARIPVTLEGTGVRALQVGVPPRDGELVLENNFRTVHVRVRERAERILYFEGEPRHEVAFLRRALRTDQDLQVVVLQRTGEDRYLRLDVDHADELREGFPRTREELFQYGGLILGSVEASYFSAEQLRMIADFVDRRGGGLLLLGGWRSLGEGGYGGTALGPVIPVELDGSAAGAPSRPGLAGAAAPGRTIAVEGAERVRDVKVSPAPRALLHPVVRLGAGANGAGEDGAGEDGAGDADPVARWESLPPLTTVNRTGALKPGASTILSGALDDGLGETVPVLSYQRYGAGLAALLAVQDTWLWQMHADIPVDDPTHQQFWRQLLRWLVQDVPEPVSLAAVRDRVAPDEPVELVATVRDASHLPVNDARVTALVTDPFGGDVELPLAWSVERDGEYRGSFVPEHPGPYEIRVRDGEGEAARVSPVIHVEAGVLDAELGSAAMRGDLLRRIAQETGGRFYTLDRASQLPEALQYTARGTVVQEERDLWDVPAIFLLLVGLLSAEWILRRRVGMA